MYQSPIVEPCKIPPSHFVETTTERQAQGDVNLGGMNDGPLQPLGASQPGAGDGQ
jgi:hypothetical protein